MMDILDDTLRQIASWRFYQRIVELDRGRYERIIADLALVIRSRVKR